MKCFQEEKRKREEKERKKQEVRKRLEEAAKAKKGKKGFMTPERKKKLRVRIKQRKFVIFKKRFHNIMSINELLSNEIYNYSNFLSATSQEKSC